MKKLYFSLFAALVTFAVNAQLTQSNHAPANGDTYDMYQCDTVSPGPAGAGVMWNFSAINTHSSIIKNYSALAAASATYPAANVVLGSSVNDVSYLSSTTNTLGYYGGNIGVGAVTGNITYTAPAIYASYPMSMNTTSSSVTGGTLTVALLGNMTATFTGNSSLLVDGSGTISLPAGQTFSNTLRVVTSQTLDLIASVATGTVTQINYNYYEAGIKAPVFSISTSTALIVSPLGNSTTTQTFVTRNKNAVVTPTTPTNGVGLTESASERFSFNVFPNPSASFVNVLTNHPDAAQLSVYDITGKLVEKQMFSEGKVKVDVSSYNKGLYLYTVSSKDNQTLKSGKLTVSH